MLRRILLPLSAALLSSACGDRRPDVDAELARDLQLATQQQANPQFQDVALNDVPKSDGVESPRSTAPPARATRRNTPAGETRAARAPRVSRPVPAAAPRPATQPTPADAEQETSPRGSGRGILAGTSFGLTTGGQVCTSNLPGDKIVATLSEPVSGENGAYLPAGTSVVLEVVSVSPGDSPGAARIALRVRSIVYGEAPISVDGQVAVLSELQRGEVSGNSGSDKKKVIGGAIAGAVIGQVLGRDTRSTVIGAAAGAAAGTAAAAATRKYHACLPAGAALRFTTSQPILLGD